jgi:hypothetical protein
MLSRQFTSELETGFIINTSSRNELSGRYVVSKQLVEEIQHPFGNIETHERKVFEFIDYSLTGESFELLELKNPARCIKKFISELSQLDNLSLTAEPVKIQIHDLLNRLPTYGVRFITVKQIDLKGISCGKNATASMIVKGNFDYANYLTELDLPLNHELMKMKVEIEYLGIRGDLEIAPNGKLKICSSLEVSLISIIRDIIKSLRF